MRRARWNNMKSEDNGIIIAFNSEREIVTKGESWTHTDSLNLAEVLNWEHKEVLKRIRQILDDYGIGNIENSTRELNSPVDLSQEFINKHTDFTYSLCYYKDKKGEFRPYYKMSKDLLILVIFSFRRLENAQQLQKLYIAQFNKMEKELQWYRARYLGIDVRNSLTDAIKDFVIGADYRDYIAFTDLVYITLFGERATQIRVMFGLKPKTNIRPMLTNECLESVKKLEQEIMQFLSYGMDYDTINDMVTRKYRGKQLAIELKMAIIDDEEVST